MRRNYYLLFTVFAFLAFFSYSCVDEDFFSTAHRHEFNDFHWRRLRLTFVEGARINCQEVTETTKTFL